MTPARVIRASLSTARVNGVLIDAPHIQLLRRDCAKALDLGGTYTITEVFKDTTWFVEFEINLPEHSAS